LKQASPGGLFLEGATKEKEPSRRKGGRFRKKVVSKEILLLCKGRERIVQFLTKRGRKR